MKCSRVDTVKLRKDWTVSQKRISQREACSRHRLENIPMEQRVSRLEKDNRNITMQ